MIEIKLTSEAAGEVVRQMTSSVDHTSRLLGIMIAVLAVVAAVVLIVALVPRRRGKSKTPRE